MKGQTISDAYGFTFTQLGTIIGLIWFPMVVSTLLNFLPQLAAGYGDATAAGTSATTCTPGPWFMHRMLQAADGLTMNLGLLGKGNASLPATRRRSERPFR